MYFVGCQHQNSPIFEYLLKIWHQRMFFSQYPNNRWELIHWTRYFHEDTQLLEIHNSRCADQDIPGSWVGVVEKQLGACWSTEKCTSELFRAHASQLVLELRLGCTLALVSSEPQTREVATTISSDAAR